MGAEAVEAAGQGVVEAGAMEAAAVPTKDGAAARQVESAFAARNRAREMTAAMDRQAEARRPAEVEAEQQRLRLLMDCL